MRNVMVALVDAAPKPLLFGGKSTAGLNKHYGVDTSFMSAIEEAWISDESTDPKDFAVPAFHEEYKKADLAPKVVAKLEDISRVISKMLGYSKSDVSLKDASVCFVVNKT